MGNYNFRQDLKTAKETENDVANILITKYGATILDKNDTNSHDIICDVSGKEFVIEIKEDFQCGKTGNVALEYSCRGKPSGIETTKAEYYIYKVHAKNSIDYVMSSVHNLRESIMNKKYFRTVNGGDYNSNSLCYLYKYDEFLKTGVIIHREPLE